MSNRSTVTQAADQSAFLRRARGEFVRSVIVDEEERSARFVALRIGLAPSSMSERLKGKSPFLADELENIARALRIDPVRFYARYIATGTQKDPASEETGSAVLVHPLGLEPRTHWIRDGRSSKPSRPHNRADRSTGPKRRAV